MTATSSRDPSRSAVRIAVAAVACALTAPGIYGLFGLLLGTVNREMPAGAIFGPVWLMASALTMIAVLVLGIPAYVLSLARGQATLVAAAACGAVAGCLVFGLLGATVLERFAARTGVALVLTGTAVGCVFWLFVRPRSK